MSRHIRILSVGQELSLLAVRNAALARAGFRVAPAHDRYQAVLIATSHFFEAAILCWSLPQDVRERLHHDLEIISPRTRVFCLTRTGENPFIVGPDPTQVVDLVRTALLNAS